MAVTANGDVPVIHGDVVQHLMDHIGHGMIFAFGITRGDQAEFVHEFHQAWDVGLRLLVPDGCGVTTGLVSAIHGWGNDGCRHGFQFLRGHQTGGVLRANDIDLHTHVRASMQNSAWCGAACVFVEDLLNGSQALTFVRDFLGCCEDLSRFHAKGLGRKALQFLAEDNGVGTASLHELYLLRGESSGHVCQLFATIFAIEFLVLGIDGQDGAGGDRIFLFQNRVAIIVQDRVAVIIQLLDPVLEVNADAAGHANGGQEDWRDAVGTGNNRCNVHERNIFVGLLAGPKRHIVDAGHAGRANAHGAFFSNQHDALVGMLFLQFADGDLVFRGHHALAVQLAVRARVGLATW